MHIDSHGPDCDGLVSQSEAWTFALLVAGRLPMLVVDQRRERVGLPVVGGCA
jgi:hypothetical protein